MVLNPDDSASEDGGDSLTKMLEWHREFIQRSYGLLQYVREELEQRHGFRGLNYSGKFVRNGSSTDPSQAIQSFLATALVPTALIDTSTSPVSVPIPPIGIKALIVQLRWLDKAQGPPVIWIVSLHARVETDRSADFNSYYLKIVPELKPVSGEVGSQRNIQMITIPADKKFPTLLASGTYFERPLADLHDERDVIDLVLAPAVKEWNTHRDLEP